MAEPTKSQSTPPRPGGSSPPRPAAAPAKPAAVWPDIVWKGEAAPSVIPADMGHVAVIASFFGWGKTTMALGADEPQNILMLDYESKGGMIAGQLGIENYFAVPQQCSEVLGIEYEAIHVYRRTRDIVAAIPDGRFTTLVLDGLTILQDGCVEQIELNPEGYGLKTKNVESGSFGGPYPGVNVVLNQLFTKARQKGIKLIVVTTEIKAKWGKDGPIINKFEMKGTSILHKMSVFSVILMQPGYPEFLGAPSGLVLKEQLAKYERVAGRQVVRKRVPPKMPCASFDELYRYLREPADFANLGEREVPTKDEMEPFKPIIAQDQLSTILKLLAMGPAVAEEG